MGMKHSCRHHLNLIVFKELYGCCLLKLGPAVIFQKVIFCHRINLDCLRIFTEPHWLTAQLNAKISHHWTPYLDWEPPLVNGFWEAGSGWELPWVPKRCIPVLLLALSIFSLTWILDSFSVPCSCRGLWSVSSPIIALNPEILWHYFICICLIYLHLSTQPGNVSILIRIDQKVWPTLLASPGMFLAFNWPDAASP